MRRPKIAARLTLCLISAALLTACPTPIRIAKPPADKLQCAPLPDAPRLTPLDWANVTSIEEARALVFRREGEVADYIVRLRGAWFSCSSTVAWHRDYNAALPE
jgi:hypothetical protein